MRREEGAGYRLARLEGLILEELRAILRDDVDDPRLEGVRLVAARLSVDYRHVRLHYTAIGDADRHAIGRALDRASPFMRARLNDALDLKRLPELRFVFDATPYEDEESDE